ncbi:sigma factor [Catellatospora bangladeshensis]|uniref:sigma factor n=1 Tax=Catellatospora bangladeshensis TaxID=310355 RepID=UPI003618D5A1
MAEDGFREFVQLRYGELLRTAYLLTGSTHAAEDLVQSALLKAYRRWDLVDDPMAYLRRALVNQRTSVWRRIGSRELLTGVLPERGEQTGAPRTRSGTSCSPHWRSCRCACGRCWCCGTGKTCPKRTPPR